MSDACVLQSSPAFAGVPMAAVGSGGLRIEERTGLTLVRLEARKGRVQALSQTIRETFGVELPARPLRVESNGTAFIGVGVVTWLVVTAGELPVSLRDLTQDSAAVSDQTGSYGILRLTGSRVRDVLAKFIPLDLHARAFAPGAAASTLSSHIPVTLWRLDDSPDGAPVFEIAAPRSYAGSFLHVVTESAT